MLQRLLPNHPKYSIYLKAKQLNLLYENYAPFKEEEIEIIKKFYPFEGASVYLRLTNRSKESVHSKAKRLGIKFERITEPWSIKEDEIVCKHYFKHITDWYSDESLEKLIKTTGNKGFYKHSKICLRMKLSNYSYLHTGAGLNHPSKHSVLVYNRSKNI